MFKMDVNDSGNDYRVASLSKSFLTATGITMQGLKSIGQLTINLNTFQMKKNIIASYVDKDYWLKCLNTTSHINNWI